MVREILVIMMIALNSKWAIALVLLITLLAALYLLGRKTVHTEIFIPAAPSVVWSVLTDVAGYREWNPVLVPIEGKLQEGGKLKYEMTGPNGKTSMVQARVVELLESRKLNQFGGVPGVLTFDHTWLLEPVEGGTRVTQHEEYRGIGVPFWNANWVEPAYAKANEALKQRILRLQREEKEIETE